MCLARNLVKAEQAGLENKSLAKQCSWWEVSSLFLSLWSGGPISQARCLLGQRKDYWSFDVCCSVKCQRQSLCIEWRLPSKVLLMCPSVSRPSINHGIRQRHISLRTRSETRNASTRSRSESPLEDRNTLFLSRSPSVSVSFEEMIVTLG